MYIFGIKLPRGWETKTAQSISKTIARQGRYKSVTLKQAYSKVVRKGNTQEEEDQIALDLSMVYTIPSPNFFDDLESAVSSGNKEDVDVLIKAATTILSWSEVTVLAIENTLAKLSIEPTTAEVRDTLGELGFTRVGGVWVHS